MLLLSGRPGNSVGEEGSVLPISAGAEMHVM